MPADSPPMSHDPRASLTAAEQERVRSLLASVTTHTLLLSLARLCPDNTDTKLIISALLHRLPFDEPVPAAARADQDPVMPR